MLTLQFVYSTLMYVLNHTGKRLVISAMVALYSGSRDERTSFPLACHYVSPLCGMGLLFSGLVFSIS